MLTSRGLAESSGHRDSFRTEQAEERGGRMKVRKRRTETHTTSNSGKGISFPQATFFLTLSVYKETHACPKPALRSLGVKICPQGITSLEKAS